MAERRRVVINITCRLSAYNSEPFARMRVWIYFYLGLFYRTL